MPYLLPIPYTRNVLEHYASVNEAFTSDECDTIIAFGTDWQTATTAAGDTTEKRRSQIQWIGWKPEIDWLFNRLATHIGELNQQFWGFDLSAFGEDLQLTKYSEDEAGHYSWHQDIGGSRMSIRKLSFVLQLTDPTQYKGGQLELFMAQNDGHQSVPVERGTLIVFPSFEPHRVTEVTSGVRHSLVGWTSGPPYR